MIMPKIFTTYCTLLVVLMAVANYQGYAITSLLTGGEKADKTANRYHK
jgi:hypothetical protein